MSSSSITAPLSSPAQQISDPLSGRAPGAGGAGIAVPPRSPSLKRLALAGSLWTMLGQGANEALRFTNHLACVWLLGIEAIGIMVVVNVLLQGLKMFSDVGIGPSIIQHKRGDDPDFLNTAWSIQIMRGGGLFLAACLLAWPIALIRDDNLYLLLLPAVALGALLNGFNSTGPSTLHRHLRIRSIETLNVTVQALTVIATIALALLLRSVWALAIGSVIGAACFLLLTHTAFRQHGNRLRWDRSAVHDLVRFGRWIFIGTALTFLCGQGDKLVMGTFVSNQDLGIYGSAFYLAIALPNMLKRISGNVLFPLLSRMNEHSIEHVRKRFAHARNWLHIASLPPMCALAICGPMIAKLLYPESVSDPHGTVDLGTILQILAAGNIVRIIATTVSPVILARGDSFRNMITLVGESALLIVAMLVGGLMWGYLGIVIGVALTPLLSYPVYAWAVARQGMLTLNRDLAWIAGCAISIGIGLWLIGAINE